MVWIRGGLVAALLMSLTAGLGVAEESMRILTYPLGLVIGELEVEADLGRSGGPADLFLNGKPVCTMTADAAACTVDLGPDPHVHLLELVGGDGERTERWLNRPGEEAELDLVLTPPFGSSCGARISWAHPLRQAPVVLEVTLDGEPLELKEGGHSVTFPCPPESDAAHALIASAIFADGRRVEAVALTGGFGGRTDVALTAVPLVVDSEPAPTCEAGAAGWPVTADRIEPGEFQVVIVLDPKAGYQTLFTSGWHAGNLPTLEVTAKASDEIFRQGTENAEPKPKNSWLKAKRTLPEADLLWYVAPDRDLHRVNGMSAGGPMWLDLLFKFGMAKVPRPHRIADAVAASGLVAGAGPYRRAVVLLLGNNVAKRDDSVLTPTQAREYLAEVGVPLIVLRNGKRREDGWPAGLAATNMDNMADSLREVRRILDRQCIAWFSAELNPQRLVDVLPEGVRLAGRGGEAPSSPESVWARAELEATEATTGVVAGAVAGEAINVTDITILISAVDADGRPVRDLEMGDLGIVESGVAVDVRALTPVVSSTWVDGEIAVPEADARLAETPGEEIPEVEGLPVTIYIDRTLGGSAGLGRGVRAVAAQADRLAVLGPVEVVVADREIATLIGPTRDGAALTAALEEAAGDLSGRHAIERIRTGFASDARTVPSRLTEAQVEGSNEQGFDTIQGAPSSRLRIAAMQAAGEENQVVSRSLERVHEWTGRQPGHRAGLLILVGNGFDEDPTLFYSAFVEQQEPHNVATLREDLRRWRQEDKVNALGRELAAGGWRVLSVAGDSFGATASRFSADTRGGQKYQQFLTASAAGVRDSTPDFLMFDPIAPQRNIARPSGGDLVVGEAGLRTALDGAVGWYRLTYQVPRPPDGVIRDLEVEARRSGVVVTTSQAVASATPEGQADARVRQLLGPAPALGELPIDLAVDAARAEDDDRLTSRVDTEVDLSALGVGGGRGGARLRISIAVAPEEGEPMVVQRQEELSALPTTGRWIYTFPVQWPPGEARLAVVVEDLRTGLWGGAIVDLSATPGRP